MDRHALGVQLGLDRVLAHQVLFKHRHKNKTPWFHVEMIKAWHSDVPRILTMAFRGSAKSTIAEEALIIRAGYREFKNALIIGETTERAAERLASIRHEIETNEMLEELFGSLIGPVWTDTELVLANNVRILSLSRGQALRGTKFQDQRPDAVFVDDLENKDTVRTPEQRRKTKVWFMTELGPALDPGAIMRVAATPLDVDALAEDLRKDPSFQVHVYPIKHKGENGQWVATWPARYNLAAIDAMEASFRNKGMMREFNMEFMCTASSDADKVFKRETFRYDTVVRTWQAVYGMFDPARTIHDTSATTGFAAWSWIGPKLHIWDAWARRLMPNEIIEALFTFCEEYDPVWAGIEEDGLNEFLMQPIRQEQVRRGLTIPVKALRAPKGKMQFIRALQPFFSAREVIFAKPMHDLEMQLLGFPTGDIDAPNALAYALKMRPGAAVYDDFGVKFVTPNALPAHGQPIWLAVNATGSVVTGILVQVDSGAVRILADWVREGDAGAWLEPMVRDAQLEAGRPVRLVCGPHHYDRFNNVGLVQAAKAMPFDIRRGVDPGMGRAEIRKLMQRDRQNRPMLQIAETARWTLNGFAGGYSRAMEKQGRLADYAEENVYRVLMEGLESLVGLMNAAPESDERAELNYAYTPGGQRYLSALQRR